MTTKHFLGKANDFLRRNDFPDDARGSAEKQSMRAASVDLAGVNSPTVIIAVSDEYPAEFVVRPDTKQRKATFWSSALDYFIESFALYGAAVHPTALFAVNSARADEQALRGIHPAERQVFTSLGSSRERD